MAVSLERAHTQLLSQGKGLAVMGNSLVDVRGSAMRGDVAEEPQGICLVATFLVLTGERQHAIGDGVRILQTASE